MSDVKFTPGPWEVRRYVDGENEESFFIDSKSVPRIALVAKREDAELFSSAPDLYKAARNAALDLIGTPDGNALDLAIAKAEGRNK